MGITGFVKDTPQNYEMAVLLGKFLINFSAIECIAYDWLINLESSSDLKEKYFKEPFAARVDIILRLIKSKNITFSLRKRIQRQWRATKDMAKFRNVIAHNPIVMVWENSNADGPPDTVGIPVMKNYKKNKFDFIPIADTEFLRTAIDDAARIAEDLINLKKEAGF